MRSIGIILFFAGWVAAEAQSLQLHFQPVFSNEKIVLEKPLTTADGSSLTVSMLKCYLGNFEFWKNGALIFVEKSYHLLNLEDESSLRLVFDFPQQTGFDSLSFNLGVDSLTTASGAMGGDLDPTQGMFWTWQSGYINFKLEGHSSKCPARNGNFEFHLGGYLPPFQTARRIHIGPLPESAEATIYIDLAPFFQKIDWKNKASIQSPGAEAVRLTAALAASFTSDEK